jgi:hypothetical protein
VSKSTDKYLNFSLSRYTLLPYMYTVVRTLLPILVTTYRGIPNIFYTGNTKIETICRFILLILCAVSGLFVAHVTIRDSLENISMMRTIIRNFIRSIDLTDDEEKCDPVYGIYIESADDVDALQSTYYCIRDMFKYDAIYHKSVFQIVPLCGVVAVASLVITSFNKQDFFQPLIVCVTFDAITSTVLFLWALTGLATMNDMMNDGVADAIDKQRNRLRKLANEKRTRPVHVPNAHVPDAHVPDAHVPDARIPDDEPIHSVWLEEEYRSFQNTIELLEQLTTQVRRREALLMFGLISITRSTLVRIGTVIGVGLFTTAIRFVFG